MDAALPGLDGTEVIRQIISTPDVVGTNVVILAAIVRDDDVHRVFQAGVRGFVAKDVEPEELPRALRVVAGGGVQVSASVMSRLLELYVRSNEHQRDAGCGGNGRRNPLLPDSFEELTAREREIVALAARGLTNGEIAAQLVVSPATAKTHVSRAMIKLHARDRAKLVALAYQTGFVKPSEDRGPTTDGRIESCFARQGDAPR